MQAWYAKMFGGVPGKRARQSQPGWVDGDDIPGANLSFSQGKTALAPTKGRSLDHIGFDVTNLDAFTKKLEALDLPAFRQVKPVVDLWRANRGRLSPELYAVLRATDLLERAVLVRKLPRSTRIVYEHFGGGIKMMRPCETLGMIGRDAHDVPDKEYGSWVADHYGDALSRRRLRLDGMRAMVATSQSATLRVRYDRLLMPWRMGGDQYVLGLSIRRELSTVA
jgi:hypothetical protein